MATLSWSDAFHAALDPCLSCIRTPSSSQHQPTQGQGRRYSDLERLLANDSSTSLDHDTDALSLHSNIGGPRRKRKSVFPKTITLFGYHLFGRPPIQLPEDEEPASEPTRPRPRTERVVSGASLDPIPDAAPLDAEAINARAVEAAERAERRARRRARKEAKKAQLALAMAGQGAEGDFEGFQGSGPGPQPHLSSVYSEDTSSASGSGSGYVRVQAPMEQYADDVDADADGDFDAGAYSRRAPRASSAGGSDSRSRTSHSLSQSPAIAAYNHQALSASIPHSPSPLSPHSPSPLSPHHDPSATPRPPKKHKKSKSSRTGSSKRSGSSAASYSVPSPSAEAFAHEPTIMANADEGQQFEGFPDDLQELPTAHAIATFSNGQVPSSGTPSPALGSESAFPSTGLGGRRSGKSDMGAFLASR